MTQADTELLRKLPRTFVPALNEQLNRWELLFPCEQRLIRAQLDYLGRLPAVELDELLRPVRQIESKMQLPRWADTSGRITVSETSALVRSPLYPQWRLEVERVFARLNEATGADAGSKTNRVLLCVLPAALPLPTGTVWPELAAHARSIALQQRFGDAQPALLRTLIKETSTRGDAVERVWLFDAAQSVADMPGLTSLSYEALAPVRKEFLGRLNLIRKDLRSLDKTYAELAEMELAHLLGPGLAGDRRIGAFIRDLFLSGNGSVIFGNSFVQWGASEAMRRVQPQAVVCCFGVRARLKPFSSVVLFEDQRRANPVPEQPDPAGSLLDARVLARYVQLTAERLDIYRSRAMSVFAVADRREILVLGPSSMPALPSDGCTTEALCAGIAAWLQAKA